jgi:hypothetical protein
MIVNAKDKKISDLASALPDVSGGVSMLLQPVKIGIVTKTQVSGLTEEETEWTRTQASLQPYTAEQLAILELGQRSWIWFTLHTLTDLVLNTDDRIYFKHGKYRVMEKLDYSDYGYFEYHVIQDYITAPIV